jgi:hypothetical protein
MHTRYFEYDYSEIEITHDTLQDLLDFEGSIPDQYSYMLPDLFDLVKKKCKIKGGYIILESIEFISGSNTILVNSQNFHVERIVYNEIKASSQIAVFLCTAGEIGELGRKMMTSGEYMEGYIVDCLGSVIVEKAMNNIHKSLQEEMSKQQVHITNRYSPGYCGWDVAEQQKLFNLFPEDFDFVKLNESSLMYPIKSVSGFIGIGEQVTFNRYTCRLCNFKNCNYRDRNAEATIINENPL